MVFRDMFCAVGEPKEYRRFLEKKGWKVFLYGLLLITLYFFLVNILPLAKFQIVHGGFRTMVEKGIPEFELKDGRLWMEGEYSLDERGMYLKINTKTDWMEKEKDEIQRVLEDNSYVTAIIADSSHLAVKSNGESVTGSFQEFGDFNLSKDDIYQFVPMLNVFIVIFLILWYLLDILLFFFGVLLISLLGMIVRSAMDVRLTFGQIFRLSLYARTTPLALKAILNMLHTPIPFFFLISLIISVAYVSLAVNGMKEEREKNDGE